MILVKLKSAPSTVHGTGCFAGARIPRGMLISFWGNEKECRFFNAKEHARRYRAGGRLIKETAVRVVGELFVEARRLSEKDPTDFINHSLKPNVGYYAGMLFSLKPISKGQELFLDYRLLNADYEVNVVRGYSASKQLRESAKQVLSAFKA